MYSVSRIDLDKCKHCSLLHDAVNANQLEFVEYLLAKPDIFKFDINRQDEEGNTALHFAASNGHDLMVQMLIKCGAELNTKDHRLGHTPLHKTMRTNETHPSTMKILLDAGCRINAPDAAALTPLHIASSVHCTASVQLLFQHGVNREMKDECNNTPLLSCTLTYYLPFFDKRGTLQLLLDAGVNVEAENLDGCRPLLALILNRGNGDDIRLMLKYGANMDALNTSKEPPLYNAINAITSFGVREGGNTFYNLLDAVLSLLYAGPNLDVKVPLRNQEGENSIRYILRMENIEEKLQPTISQGQYSEKTSEKLAEFINYIKAIEDVPSPLVMLCRRPIRSSVSLAANGMSKEFLDRTQRLPLPAKLRAFLQCQPDKAPLLREHESPSQTFHGNE